MEPSDVITSPADASRVVEPWRDLVDRPGMSYFSSPDWAMAWWETVGSAWPVEVAVWRDGSGRLEAVVALTRVRERLHPRAPLAVPVWINLGSGVGSADHCAWPISPERLRDVHAWLSERARESPLLLRDLDPETGVPAVPGSGRLVARSACPRMRIPTAGDELGRSSNFRQQLRSFQRRADRLGLLFRWIPPAEMTVTLLDRLLDLHARRRAMKDAPSSFDRRRLPLHRRVLEHTDGRRGPAAMVAEVDSRVVGVLYGFLWGDVFAYYQSGWDPDWEHVRLGYLLVSNSIWATGVAGARWFDFLRGTEGYKYRFGASDRIDQTWIVPTGVVGRVLLAKYWAKDAIDRRRSAQPSSSRRTPSPGPPVRAQ